MFNARIIATGRYVPENIITNECLSKFMDTSDEWIKSRTGIMERRISTGENTSDLCTKAAISILEKSNLIPEDIELIIVATSSPDYKTPSTACLVQKNVGAVNAFAFDISAACTGFIYALSVGEKMIRSGVYQNALILGGEVLSKIVDWEDRNTAVIFGDGAGGVLLQREESNTPLILKEDLKSDGSMFDSLKGGFSPVNNHFVKNQEKDQYLDMDGRVIYDFVMRTIPSNIQKVLKESETDIEEVKYIVPHQANMRMIEVMAKKLKTDIHKFIINIEKYGNTSAGSIPIALSEMADSKQIALNGKEKLLLTGFGAGLTWGTMLIHI